MNQKTVALILSLFFITVILLGAAFQANRSSQQPAQDQQQPQQPSAPVASQAQTVLSLSPNPVTLGANNAGAVEVVIAPGDNPITGVQLELEYDPKALTNVQVEQADYFTQPITLFDIVDKETGRATFAIGINPQQEPTNKQGTVARITFTKAPGATMAETNLTLLPSSVVSASGVSDTVLKSVTSTTVRLSQ